MIYTITLNPAIDHIFETKNFQIDQTNYYLDEYEMIGGKGINVASMLKLLNLDVVATGLLGSKNSQLFNDKFKAIKLKEKFFTFNGSSRTNYKVIDFSNQKSFTFKGKATASDLDGAKLLDFLNKNLVPKDIVIVSGSVPHTITPMIYYQIGMIVKRNQGLFILDSNGIWLKKALKVHPFLIKVSLGEICELLKLDRAKYYTFAELKNMVFDLEKLGARNVLVQLKDHSSVYYEKSSNTFYKINPISAPVVNMTGSGDSLLAGFIYGFVNNLGVEQSLKYAQACAASTSFNRGLGSLEQIEKFVNEVDVHLLKA